MVRNQIQTRTASYEHTTEKGKKQVLGASGSALVGATAVRQIL